MQPILILGMHRSGTSMFAEMVVRWGAYPGAKERLIKAHKTNPRGHWEYKPLVLFNDKLLKIMKLNWAKPPISIPKSIINSSKHIKTAKNIINQMEDTTWMWKDPRLSVLLPFWMPLLKTPAIIFCFRNPLEVALSLKKRNNINLTKGVKLWEKYNSIILKQLHNHDVLILPYHKTLEQPKKYSAALCQYLNELCETTINNVSHIIKAINPDLKNQRSMLNKQYVNKNQRNLYKYLNSLPLRSTICYNET